MHPLIAANIDTNTLGALLAALVTLGGVAAAFASLVARGAKLEAKLDQMATRQDAHEKHDEKQAEELKDVLGAINATLSTIAQAVARLEGRNDRIDADSTAGRKPIR